MTDDGMEGRKRLIDHFKRVYTIVAGLAITEAVRRLFPIDVDFFHGPAPWLFTTFILTIVPIFHGGDRSLDAKYWGKPRPDGWARVWFLVDVWALLITAMLFVAIAEAIPKPTGCSTNGVCAHAVTFREAGWFTALIGATMAIDIVVLAAEILRGRAARSDQETSADQQAASGTDFLQAYPIWIGLNLAFTAVCAFATCMAWDVHGLAGALPAIFTDLTIPVLSVAALARTLFDYRYGGDSLFP